MPTRSERYQLPSYPPTNFTRELWNSVFEDIALRLEQRETLEASFETLLDQGIQASLDYIQEAVAPQVASLQSSITLAQEQIDKIVIDGVSPDAEKLGGHPPSHYATASALSNGLSERVPTTRKVNGKSLSTNVVLAKSDIGLGSVDNTRDEDKPVSTPQAEAIGERIRFFAAADPLPSNNIGPIWHEAYASIMTWQVFDQNGADFEGYASVGVGTLIGDSQANPRSGYLKASGLILSKTTYAALWNWALNSYRAAPSANYGAGNFMFGDNGDGTFIAPDVRGEFMRFLDDGRGVNPGRTIGSWEDATYTRQAMNDYADSDGATTAGNFLVGQSFAGADKVSASTPGGAKTGDNTTFAVSSADNFSKANQDNNAGFSALWISYRPRNFATLASIKF